MKALKIIGIILANLLLPIFLTGIMQFFMLIILGIDLDNHMKLDILVILYFLLLFLNMALITLGFYEKMLKD